MQLLVHGGPSLPGFPFGLFDDGGEANVLPPDLILGPPPFRNVNRVVTCPRMLSLWEDG
jgi:hypothetical protein